MKRLLVALTAVLVFASCNNDGGGNTEQRMKDSLDSIKNLKIESIDEAAQQAKDTIQQGHDSLVNRIDQVAGETRDSLKGNK
jgi:cellobiose-specific phosphotransferase system component IIA